MLGSVELIIMIMVWYSLNVVSISKGSTFSVSLLSSLLKIPAFLCLCAKCSGDKSSSAQFLYFCTVSVCMTVTLSNRALSGIHKLEQGWNLSNKNLCNLLKLPMTATALQMTLGSTFMVSQWVFKTRKPPAAKLWRHSHLQV